MQDVNSGRSRDLVGYGMHPPRLEWPGEARLALNFVINYESGSERSFAHGDGRNEGLGELPRPVDPEFRDLATESVYEYGSRAGIHRLMRIFAEFDTRVTFFAAALALEKNPELCDAIRAAGHEVAGHGYRWSEDWLVSRAEEKARIQAAVESIARTCGKRPVGWYNRWMPSESTRELLLECGGFTYDSNSYNDDIPYVDTTAGQGILVLPYTLTYNDVRYSAAGGLTPTGFVDLCRRGIAELAGERDGAPRMMSIGLHPRWSGQAGRASAVREILEALAARDDVWVATREQIADWWTANAVLT